MTAHRPPNPWLEDTLKHGQAHDSFVAINPTDNPDTWKAWRDYFTWLNWAPFWFREVETLHYEASQSARKYCIASWTAPCDHPDDLTCKFKSAPPPRYGGQIFMPLRPLPPKTPEAIEHVRQSLERFRRDMAAVGRSNSPAARVVEQAAQAFLNHGQP